MNPEARRPLLIAPLVLRLALAAIFIYRGYLKVTGPANDWGANWLVSASQKQDRMPKDLEEEFNRLASLKDRSEQYKKAVVEVKNDIMDYYGKKIQQPGSRFTLAAAGQLAVAWGELAGGLALLLGVLTRLAAAGLIIIQFGAIYYLVAFQQGVFATESTVGYEYNLALIAVCIALIVSGAGLFSLDHWWWARRQRQAAAPSAPSAPPTVPTAV
jgi:uncharacterized membrane protein YphA (DoxX/SURF4 family)